MIKTPHWPVPLGYKPIDLGLDRIKELLAKLGNPEKKLPLVIHFAGTNGKGSTIAFLRAMFEAAGYKVHVYTSPHLVYFNERIVLAGKQIDDKFLYEVLEECKTAAGDMRITYFEGITAAAFLAFSRVDADVVMLETGMGGRYDATNIIDKPALTVITPISIDHSEFLGDTIAKIAYEKAGIIKDSVPCVVSLQDNQALEVITRVAAEKRIKLYSYGTGWQLKDQTFKSDKNKIKLDNLSLQGEHQLINAATAIACTEKLTGFKINKSHMEKGLTSAIWPGRLQRLKKGKFVEILPQDWELWVDGAHNIAGAEVLAQHAEYWERANNMPLYLIVGMLQNRNPADFLVRLAKRIKMCVAIPIEGERNCHRPSAILQSIINLEINSDMADNLEGAIDKIITKEKSPARILICGSLYLAGVVLAENGL